MAVSKQKDPQLLKAEFDWSVTAASLIICPLAKRDFYNTRLAMQLVGNYKISFIFLINPFLLLRMGKVLDI